MTAQFGETRRRPDGPRSGRRIAATILGVVACLLLVPGLVLAHAELDTSEPAEGTTVTGTPASISATYTETLDPDGSSLVLVDFQGTELATGGVSSTTEPTKEMVIQPVPELVPGEYTVKSTTKSAADGDLDRKTWAFTVIAAESPSPSATPEPTPQCTDECNGVPSNQPTPTAPPSISLAPTVAPSASAGPGPTDPAASTGDAIVPIIVGLAVVALAAAYFLTRRGRPSGPE
jgi:methionine-rich copper-binding protein CopC